MMNSDASIMFSSDQAPSDALNRKAGVGKDEIPLCQFCGGVQTPDAQEFTRGSIQPPDAPSSEHVYSAR